MKKLLALLLSLLLAVPALAEAPESVSVYVSITDDTGALALACVPVTVTDLDADGTLTIADALTAAHAAHHPDGAAAFSFAPTQYGLSMTCLWGVENGGSYGYFLNDASAWSLVDPVKEGDHIKAYAYTDLVAWSDTYSFFSSLTAAAAPGAPVALTLFAAGYDENWNPVTLPVSGAVITVDGAATQIITDASGCAEITFAAPGAYVISAICDTMTLVPPVCIVTVTAE